MTPEQWFWMALIALNAFNIGMRIVLMERDGVAKLDWVFISGAALIIAWGTWVIWSTS
jgi:hypothetical protein